MSRWPDCLDRRPAGVVFDCDGLLVDTEPSWDWANEQLFLRRGREMAEVDTTQLLGLSTPASIALLALWLDEVGRERELFDELLVAVSGRIQTHAQVMPGAAELVGELRDRGVPVAVASNSPLPIVELALTRGGLADSFDVVVSADHVQHPKPAPDLYLLACSRLGVASSAAIGCEDSRTGLAAVQAAGMGSIGVPTLPGDFPADWVLPSLAHPAVADWISSWG